MPNSVLIGAGMWIYAPKTVTLLTSNYFASQNMIGETVDQWRM